MDKHCFDGGEQLLIGAEPVKKVSVAGVLDAVWVDVPGGIFSEQFFEQGRYVEADEKKGRILYHAVSCGHEPFPELFADAPADYPVPAGAERAIEGEGDIVGILLVVLLRPRRGLSIRFHLRLHS